MFDTLRLAASQARYDDYQVRLFYSQTLDDARAMGIKPFVDPLNVGPRSVCIPIRHPPRRGAENTPLPIGFPCELTAGSSATAE